MITAARAAEIRSVLAVAGAGWATVARRLPEFERLSHGRPSGPGLHRPWVLLNDDIEDWDAPPRLVRFDTGHWFLKGERVIDFTRRTT